MYSKSTKYTRETHQKYYKSTNCTRKTLYVLYVLLCFPMFWVSQVLRGKPSAGKKIGEVLHHPKGHTSFTSPEGAYVRNTCRGGGLESSGMLLFFLPIPTPCAFGRRPNARQKNNKTIYEKFHFSLEPFFRCDGSSLNSTPGKISRSDFFWIFWILWIFWLFWIFGICRGFEKGLVR